MIRMNALLLCGALGVTACQQPADDAKSGQASSADKPDKEAAVTPDGLTGTRVEVAVLGKSTGELTLTVPGEVKGNRDASLASALGGYIERVRVKEGDRVKAGQVLATVDSATHSARQGRASVELKSAERELQRTESIADSIPRAEVDAARDRVAAAKATLRELYVNASRAVLKTPFSGVVVKVEAEVGEIAAPGVPLFRVVQLSPAKVSLTLSDRDMALARKGTLASVSLDARSGLFQGKVTAVAPAADMSTRSFEATVELENKDEVLLPGMIANVTLRSDAATQDADRKLVVSQDWLVTKPERVGVFVEKDGRAQWREVTLGAVLRKQVVVNSGLSEGDAIIILGHRDLADGDKVLVHRRGRCCENGRAVFDAPSAKAAVPPQVQTPPAATVMDKPASAKEVAPKKTAKK